MQPLNLPAEWQRPPAEFSLVPFWFWNDDLDDNELARQIDDFQAHGIDAFLIHPRVGLPRHLGWMSRPLLDKMRFAIEQAQARGMWVILYDEGMYPSGSSSGQVVAENPAYQCRGMVRINLDDAQPDTDVQGVRIGKNGEPALTADQSLVAIVAYQGQRYAIVDRPVSSIIRGLHYISEDPPPGGGDPPEDSPPATDLLNPEAVACFIRLVYDRYFTEFGDYFGTIIPAIFTDEPMLLGRPREKGLMPGTRDILEHINSFLGYDFTPHLPALWDADAPPHIMHDFERAIEARLQHTYYKQLYDWCEAHHIALTGHPAEADATANMRFFHWPTQDIVWRWVEPDNINSIEGRQSTQGKAAASVMLHEGRRRNGNEFCGAFGHEFTFDEMRWLANWLLVRGCNLLIPHAFYYSMRGPRKDERPPDVGPNSAWWNAGFTEFADACRRLCWLNTDSEPVCQVAILGEHHHLPWRAARACFENQIDFHYVDTHDLCQQASVRDNGIHLAGQHYAVLIVDDAPATATLPLVEQLEQAGRVVRWSEDRAGSMAALRTKVTADVSLAAAEPGLRMRHVRKADADWYILFNEGTTDIDTRLSVHAAGNAHLIDPVRMDAEPFDGRLRLEAHGLRVLVVQ
ncbi:MAG: hypothetical protein CL610_00870 [Anaerolineaceae bacterium]|nr:hypothetical protein [Anaerolineaceae bacterium]